MATKIYVIFFFNDTATTEIYPLSLHDALPILAFLTEMLPPAVRPGPADVDRLLSLFNTALIHDGYQVVQRGQISGADRKSTRLNSSHLVISYAVFCLKKKNNCYV